MLSAVMWSCFALEHLVESVSFFLVACFESAITFVSNGAFLKRLVSPGLRLNKQIYSSVWFRL